MAAATSLTPVKWIPHMGRYRTQGTLKRGEPHRSRPVREGFTGHPGGWPSLNRRRPEAGEPLRSRGEPNQRAISGLWCWAKTALSPAQTRPRSGTFCS